MCTPLSGPVGVLTSNLWVWELERSAPAVLTQEQLMQLVVSRVPLQRFRAARGLWVSSKIHGTTRGLNWYPVCS